MNIELALLRKIIKQRSKWLLLFMILLIEKEHAFAQEAIISQPVKQFLDQVTSTYSNAPFLSFDIRYTYAPEKNPSAVIDSLNGKVQLNGSNYKMQLDNMITVKNEHHIISVFTEDKVMLVSSLSANRSAVLPFIDSSLYAIRDAVFNLSETRATTILSIALPFGGFYRSISLEKDKATGYIIHARYEVMEQREADTVTNNINQSYAIVETVFSNYKKNSFEESILADDHFFIEREHELVGSKEYSDYQVISQGNTTQK